MLDKLKRGKIMDGTTSFAGWGIVIFLVILFAVFWGGFGNRGRGNYGTDDYAAFQNYKAIVDAEKREIINTATTQYNVEQQAALTRELIAAQTNAINTKIDYYGFQNERDKNAQLQRENMELRNQLFVKDQLAPINAQLASIRCNMLTKPEISGVGVACPSAAILNGLGVNSLSNGCGCNHNGVLI